MRSRLLLRVASEASRFDRLLRRKPAARLLGWQFGIRQRKLLGPVDMAFRAVSQVTGEADLIKFVRGAAKAVNREVGGQVFAAVDLVDHALEVNAFRRELVGRAAGCVASVWVVAEHAIFDVIANASMQLKKAVAPIAVC